MEGAESDALICEGNVEVFEGMNKIVADIKIYMRMRKELVKLLGPECASDILDRRRDEIAGKIKNVIEEKLGVCKLRWKIVKFSPQPVRRNVKREDAYLPIRVILHTHARGIIFSSDLEEALFDLQPVLEALTFGQECVRTTCLNFPQELLGG